VNETVDRATIYVRLCLSRILHTNNLFRIYEIICNVKAFRVGQFVGQQVIIRLVLLCVRVDSAVVDV
jgi:hypothetical protein